MGCSYSAKAGYTLDAINVLIGTTTSNGMPDGGFYEHGRERADGAITGTVYRSVDAGHCRRCGSFRIEASGKVKRFPGLPALLLREAEARGAARYAANYGTWRERGLAMLADLDSGKIDGRLSWTWFESIFREWRREARIMFVVQPAATNRDMARALRGMLGGE